VSGRLAIAIIGACILLVVPVVLWMRLAGGEGGSMRTIVLVVATTMLCWALVSLVGTPRARHDVAAAAQPVPNVAPPAPCRRGTRRSARAPQRFPRMRGGTPARAERQTAGRPLRTGRAPRNVHCHASAHRTARRRTRP
jgi:hypothetical protein